jgi:hypothetical protein
MSDISDISCTPPEIREAGNVAIQNLLPTKSRKRYEVLYEKFVQWCKTKISKIILKIVCWHIFKAFLAKSYYENPGKLYFMN